MQLLGEVFFSLLPYLVIWQIEGTNYKNALCLHLAYDVQYKLYTPLGRICVTLTTLAISSEYLRDTCGHLRTGDTQMTAGGTQLSLCPRKREV